MLDETITPSREKVVYPAKDAFTVYVPGSTGLIVKLPSEPEEVLDFVLLNQNNEIMNEVTNEHRTNNGTNQ